MLYLNESNIQEIGVNWKEVIDVIEKAVESIGKKDFAQPIKPYLRYKDMKNRIIAMPAYVGGNFNVAGIKWIASFPDNINHGLPRAHSVVVLNNSQTGEPISFINTGLLSSIRTSSVTGVIIKKYLQSTNMKKFNIGIIGWGPIGRNHFKMCMEVWEKQIERVYLYDIKGIDLQSIDSEFKDKIVITNSWEEVMDNVEIFMTCTVSKTRHINRSSKKCKLYLNISLRDFDSDFYKKTKPIIIVDDWEEVCRENTDVELFHNSCGLQKENTKNLVDVVCNNYLEELSVEESIMFNPMGMSTFDMAIACYYLNKGLERKIGLHLD